MYHDGKGEDALRVALDYMQKTKTRGKVIFAVITGSQAYNVAQEVLLLLLQLGLRLPHDSQSLS